MASGGSGGHIYPSIALADELKKNHKVSFIGYKGKMEDKVIKNHGYDICLINKGNKKYFSLFREYKNIKNEIKNINPDIVIGWGNSLSFLSVLAAKKLNIKTIVHEQNIIPGKANKYSSYFVDKIALSYEETKKYIKKGIVVGNPRGEASTNLTKKYNLDKSKINVLIVMGSLGSSSVINFFLSLLNNIKINAHFIISIGANVKLKESFSSLNDVEVYEYIDSLPSLMKEVDLVISRAGATILSEIEALNVVSLLIPSPYVTNNHQYINAKYMVDKGLAMMIEEKNLNEKSIKKIIEDTNEHIKIKMNLLNNKKNKGITNFIKLINDKYSK